MSGGKMLHFIADKDGYVWAIFSLIVEHKGEIDSQRKYKDTIKSAVYAFMKFICAFIYGLVFTYVSMRSFWKEKII